MRNFMAFGYHTAVAFSLRETFKQYTSRSIMASCLKKMFQNNTAMRTFPDQAFV
ncbi:unnamed protein product [Ixodes pacificus]